MFEKIKKIFQKIKPEKKQEKLEQDFLNKIKLYLVFFRENKELVFIPYLIGIAIQTIILISILGFSGLSYISITYSLIIFVILCFLIILSIPVFFLFMIGIFILSLLNLWGNGVVSKIFIIVYLFILLISPFIISRINCLNNIKEKYKNKIHNFYIKSGLIIIIILIYVLIYFTFGFKVAVVNYGDNKEILGKYLFYNQDYYFFEVCGRKIVIPANKIESIEIKTESYKLSSMKLTEKDKLNQEYTEFCKNYLNK